MIISLHSSCSPTAGTASLVHLFGSEKPPRRRPVFATYRDYVDFLYRLPRFVHDVASGIKNDLRSIGQVDALLEDGRRMVDVLRELQPLRRPPRAVDTGADGA